MDHLFRDLIDSMDKFCLNREVALRDLAAHRDRVEHLDREVRTYYAKYQRIHRKTNLSALDSLVLEFVRVKGTELSTELIEARKLWTAANDSYNRNDLALGQLGKTPMRF